jgi:hypothetical protein
MMNLLDESGLQQLVDLVADDLALLLVEEAQALFHRSRAGSDLQDMLYDFLGYARHIRGTPRNDVDVCTEKVDEHCFLFGIEGGADAQRLSVWVGGIEGYELVVFHGLEVADMALGSRISLAKPSRFAAKVANSRTTSPCSTHSTSHS